MTKVRFLPAAELELLREVAYYAKARPGTGERFNAAVKHTVALAANHPLGGAPSRKETRTMRVKGFPFNVIYRPREKDILIVAIAPHRKRPFYWQSRIG